MPKMFFLKVIAEVKEALMSICLQLATLEFQTGKYAYKELIRFGPTTYNLTNPEENGSGTSNEAELPAHRAL